VTRLRMTAPLVVLLVLLVPVRGPAREPDAASQLRTVEQFWLQASVARDRAMLERLLANDFVHIDYQGRLLHRKDALNAPVAPAGVLQRLSNLDVRVFGDTGIVTGVNTITSTDGKLALRLRFTDVFIRANGYWRAVSAQETNEQPSGAE
jgi:ketosteroid isomerase-like protein